MARIAAKDVWSVCRTADRRTAVRYIAAIALSGREIVSARSLVPADERMKAFECRFKPSTTEIVLPGEYFSGARELYCRGVYFPNRRFWPRPNEVVVDAGANVGLFTVLAATSGCKTLAIEAQRGFLPMIRRNAHRNGCASWVEVEWALLGSATGRLADPHERENATHWDGEPPRLTMQDVLRRHGIDRIDLLKVDIEGSEFALLDGDSGWMTGVRRLCMEVHPAYGDADALAETIAGSGMRVWRAANDYLFAERSLA